MIRLIAFGTNSAELSHGSDLEEAKRRPAKMLSSGYNITPKATTTRNCSRDEVNGRMLVAGLNKEREREN